MSTAASQQPHQDLSKYGSIQLKTDKPSYHAGETVSGEIYIEILENCPNTQLYLSLEGKEATFVADKVYTRDGPQIDMKKDKRTIIKQESCIHTWDMLSCGHYVIPFSFLLPSDLPASFCFEATEQFAAFVRYNLGVSLQNKDHLKTGLKNQLNLVLRDRLNVSIQAVSEETTTALATCCCISKGTNILRLNIEKNLYNPNELVRAIVELDNSASKLDNSKVTLCVKQRLKLKYGIGRKEEFISYSVQTQNGIKAGAPSAILSFETRLPPFHSDDHKLDDSEDGWPWEKRTGVGATTHSKLIDSDYFLEVSCPMKDSSVTPKILCPIQINYPDPANGSVTLPSSWNPQHLERINVAFSVSKANKKSENTKEACAVKTEMINIDIPNQCTANSQA